MWVTLQDKYREYNINLKNLICFGRMEDCKNEHGIELVFGQGAINLIYDHLGDREIAYDNIRQKIYLSVGE